MPSPNPNISTVEQNQEVHSEELNSLAEQWQGQGGKLQSNVSVTGPDAQGRAVADQVVTVTGASNGTLTVPSGYVATDLNGNELTSIQLSL